MEHQELEPLATALLPVDIDAEDDDEEYKVESEIEADDTESDEGDELEVLPQEEDTLHLLDIADDLLGNLEEDVLSDSECVESDSEDDDEEECIGVPATNSSPQQQLPGEMDKHKAVRMPQQQRPTWEASVRCAHQAGSQEVGRDPAKCVATQQSTPLHLRCGAPLCSEGRQQQQWIPQKGAGCSSNWDAPGSGMPAIPVSHGRQDVQKAGNGSPPSLPTAAVAYCPVGIATPQAPELGTQKDPDGSPCRGDVQMQEQPVIGEASLLCGINGASPLGLRAQQQDKPHGQMHGQDRLQGQGEVVYPPSGGICRRTRTHVSLRDVALSELEQQLPEHIDIEEIELAEDDEEYGKFLQTLFDDTAALPEDSSDEDPDFAADLDLDLDEASKDDDDDDRGWLKLLKPVEREGCGNEAVGGEPTEDSPARRTRARSRRGNAKGGAAGASESGEAGGAVEMTAEQLSVLHAQVHCHTQLLIQTYLMFATDMDSEAQDLAMKAKAMLEQLAMCRDAQSTTRRLLGFASYTPEELLRTAAVQQPLYANTAPVASTGVATSCGANGERSAASGSTEGGCGGGAAAATASSCAGGLANEPRTADAWGRGRALTQQRGLQRMQGQLPVGMPLAAAAAAPVGPTTIHTQGQYEISQDEISMGGSEWDWDPIMSSAAAGMPAVKAAAAARSASLSAAISAFRPTWCPGPEGGVWSVLDVVPLRKFPEVQGVLQALPAMPYSTMKLQRDLQAITKSKRKKRRRRMDDPLLAAMEWSRPALQCLQSHLLTALAYHPSPPVPPSYWTFAEDDLMMYGMSRHGTNWRLIAKTLLVTRNASQIANRYKNLNARRRMPEEHADDGRVEELQTQALSAAAPGVAGGLAVRKPKSGPATRPKAPAPGACSGMGVGQATGASAVARANTLQTTAALPVATGLAGAGANTAAAATVAAAAALLTPPMPPELAAMVHSARIVGLPPAVAAAHIMQAQQQLRPHLQPPPQPAPPQVPLSVAVQLLQMAKAGGMTGPGAVAARLLAAQLQEPHTALAVISALQGATHQLMTQPSDPGRLLSAAATAASKVTVTGPAVGGKEGLGGLLNGTGAACQSGATGCAGCLDSAVDLGVPSILAQLLQARLATNNAAALATPFTQQASQVASKVILQTGASGASALPLPLPLAAAQQALLSLRQSTAPFPVCVNTVAANTQGQGPAVAAMGPAALAGPQTAAKKDQFNVAVGEVADNGSGVVIPVPQHPPTGPVVPLPEGAAEPINAPRPWQEHDHKKDDPMHWTPQSPSSPSCPGARGSGGRNCVAGVHDAVVAAVAAPPRGPCGTGLGVGMATAGTAAGPLWQQQPHCGWQEDPPCGVLARPVAVTDTLPTAEARRGTGADAVLHTGPTDPRLSHGKELPGHCPQQRAHLPPHSQNLNDLRHQQQQQPRHYHRAEVSPGEQLLQHAPHHNHEPHVHQHQPHHDLPSLSDNFTLGGISELLGHGALRSGAATPATVSPQGGLASICLSHGHTMSLLLGSGLGVSALLRSDVDGDSVTSIKSGAGGPLRTNEPLCDNDQDYHGPCGRQVPDTPCEPQTKEIGSPNADGTRAVEVVEVLRTPGRKHQPGETAPPLPPRLQTPQLFSPKSPTDAGRTAYLKGKESGLPPRIAALRGLDLTPSSDPKARRRSRIATGEHAAGRTMLHALAPSPFEGTAQNHREGRGKRNGATDASYCPRPPLFAEEPGADGQPFPGGCLRLLEGSVIAEDDDEGDAAAEGLARARKRLRLDVEDEVNGAGKVSGPLLLGPFEAGTTAAPIDMHGLGPLANSVAASPVERPSSKGGPAAAAAAAVLVSTDVARTISGTHSEPQLQSQHVADTGSSGDSKRRSGSMDRTSSGSCKRVRQGQVSGRLESDGADAAAGGMGPGRRGPFTEAVAAPDMDAGDVATYDVCGGRDIGRQQRPSPGPGHEPCRLAGQKRNRSGAGQKPTTLDSDSTARFVASGPHCEPLAVVDANANVRTTEVVVAGPPVSPSGSCVVAGVSAVPAKIPVKHLKSCTAATAAGSAETTSKAATDGISAKPPGGAPTVLVAKPPKAPTRRGAGWAQSLTRVSAIAGARPAPLTRQRRNSQLNGARSNSIVPASAPPPACISPENSRANHVAATAAISSSPRSLHMLFALGSVADSEVSSGGVSLHSLLCSADTLDIASLLPSMSTRSLAAAVTNVCSPTSRPGTVTGDPAAAPTAAERPPAPVTVSGHNPVDMKAPVLTVANTSADVGPTADVSLATAAAAAAAGIPIFMSPPRSQLMQLTPFAQSGCTLGSLDILPLFSNSTDLWNALQVGSALGTTSRGPEARVVAGSTAGDDGSDEGPNLLSGAPSNITPLDPWSRFMASCSPSAHIREESAPLPSAHDNSRSAFHTFLASIAGPGNTVADATFTMVVAAATTATEQAAIEESASEPEQCRVRNGTGTGNGGAAAGPRAAGAIVAAGKQASGDDAPAALLVTAAAVEDVGGGTSKSQELSRPQSASGLPPLEVATRTSGPGVAEARPTGALEAVSDAGVAPTHGGVGDQHPGMVEAVAGVRPLLGNDPAGIESPGPRQHHAPDTCAAADVPSKPAGGTAGSAYGGLLPPLPPAFPSHGLAPSPVAQPPPDSRPPAPETVRLFGRTVAKPLPIASPSMPAPLSLLRSPALAAAPLAAAAEGVVRPLHVSGSECAVAPLHVDRGEAIVPAAGPAVADDNSNSQSRTKAETGIVLPPPPPLPALVLQTPAHGSTGGGDSRLRGILSPVDVSRAPTSGLFDTPLIATIAAAAAPTPLQPPCAVAAAAAAAAAAAQQTPAAVAPAGAFAVPDTHATVAIAAPLSLTPLPLLNATASKTVGRRGTWEARRLHAPLGVVGPSISHWASNDHDPVHEPGAPGTDFERQACGGWRNAALPHWRGTRTAHMAGGAAGGPAVDTPGHVTCFSKVAQRGLAAVDPLALPSPSVVQPTPRGRHGDDGEEVVALRGGYSPCEEDEYGDREGAGDSQGSGAADADAAGEAGEDVYPCGSPAVTVDRDNDTDGGAEEEAVEEVLACADSPGWHASVAAAAYPIAAAVATNICAGGAVGIATDVVVGSAPVVVAAVPAQEPDQGTPAVVATVGVATAGPAWSKELDQLVMREIFRLGEGQSTWRSISDHLGASMYTVEAVEARGKLLMARMMQLM
ncbi:hypothetical protein VaNZ11_015359 [Volvox africanus]|uniref:Myb-like domain-containing protein n=1 Tax=Volvox africanus TaxID=51714 RepID=A0ABQ5SMT9_9CHLO|nr:hypothetical protein VaNZ11_015359 [Volvox africanus]